MGEKIPANAILALTVAAVLTSLTAIGCVGGPLTTREKAAGIGAIGGAATGAAIGSTVDRPGTGALIGGAIGLGAGALIGDQLQAQEQAQQEPRAAQPQKPITVERGRGEEVVVIKRDPPGRAYPKIPPGHLPPPGKCRVWLPNRPPGHQPPPGECHILELQVPSGAYLIYGG